MSYAMESYNNDRKAASRLTAAFAAASLILWPASYIVHGYGADGSIDWWNATTVIAWVAAAVCSIGFMVAGGVFITMQAPIDGANR